MPSGEDLSRLATPEGGLRSHGIDVAPSEVAISFQDAKRAANRLGYPAAAKLMVRKLAHKSDIGDVCSGINSDENLEHAFAKLDAIPIAEKEGILIQSMVRGPVEVFVGMTRDEAFGPVIVVGIGGIYVEMICETAMRLASFDALQAERLIRGQESAAFMDGTRGRPKLNIAVLTGIASGVSRPAMTDESILSLDLNPAIVGEKGAVVVDSTLECRELH